MYTKIKEEKKFELFATSIIFWAVGLHRFHFFFDLDFIEASNMFTSNLRCVPLGRSQTSQATPSPAPFCWLCVGGSGEGERGSRAFSLLTVEVPSCFVFIFLPLLFNRDKH